jgi:hypothetical protein
MQILFDACNPYRFCDPNAGITFEEEKSNVCSMDYT